MLKFMMFILFMIPISLNKKNFWMVQVYLMMISFFFMLLLNNSYLYNNLSYFMGMDLISYGLIFLSFWICYLMMMASQNIYESNYSKMFFSLNVLILLLMLFMSFCSLNLFYFYLFFEASLIPTLFLIIGWGYQPERLQAGIYLLFYTLLASLPMLISIFFLYYMNNSLMYYYLNNVFNINYLFYISMLLAFLVKMPMFFVHLWLPKAHVEAPISGSMILAGIMLKLGGYGMVRVMNILLNLGLKYNFIWVSISLVGGFLVSLICLRQVDMKSLIAYSSVSHMSLVIAGIMSMSYWGFMGSYSLMIAHGLCSSGLFCLANMSYERSGSRSLLINKGMMNFMPSLCMWWFLLSSANMAAPPTLNLLGEIGLLNSIISWSWLSMIFLSLMSFFSAAYTLFLYSYTQHGDLYSGLYSSMNGNLREYILLMLHWLPLNYLILKSEVIFLWL
uniref:NADH-ubiquinone oxidoreductase chain 4 n=1 Tax=Eumantispa harmandi TaxID=1593348 RepID=A0A1S5QYG3_9NEOP|nr:NADH dehydrogenase subunit 4 [Eumantispa harmandi]AMW67938.1 NADH dehydrogenase subunit 4 [Eumantispa harmandi]AYG51266.1 NADH dehydrogenase subunit 4 [Eumantispa harmandi]